jgi:D-glycerate 3-kinase
VLPRFDKASDDRAPESQWPSFAGRPEAILFDGWCLGALPDEMGPAPLNALEAEEDAEGRWRALINADLSERYQAFFDAFDAMIYLKAPSWEIVRRWRGQQEAETMGRPLTADDETRLDRFLMHYERITRSMLAGRHRARCVVHLDEKRNVVRVEER